MDRFAGVELGGTKIVCGVAAADGKLLGRLQLDTGPPESTLPAVQEALAQLAAGSGEFGALGIGSFGPVHLDRRSADYGRIGQTPKSDWRGYDLLGFFRQRFRVPVLLDTDVAAAAFGEARWGAGQGADTLVYITVGTGIGAGILVDGRPVHGLMHPEVGHIRVPRAAGDDYPGSCPYHADCVEGMAAGPSVVARWGARLAELPDDHAAFRQVAHYLSHLVAHCVLFVSPGRVILGGGVMSNRVLYPMIREGVRDLLAGYLAVPQLQDGIESLIVAPALGDDAGVLGAIAMVTPSAVPGGN